MIAMVMNIAAIIMGIIIKPNSPKGGEPGVGSKPGENK